MTKYFYDGVFAPHADSQKIFLHTPDGDISYAEFTALTDRIAAMLVAAGLAPGDRVAVQADKSVMLFALYVATVKAGGVYLPLNTGYTAAELDYFLGDAKPRIVVVAGKAEAAIAPIATRIGAALMTLEADESGTLRDAAMSHEGPFSATRKIWRPYFIPRAPPAVRKGPSCATATCARMPRCFADTGASRLMMCCFTCCRSITRTACSWPATCWRLSADR